METPRQAEPVVGGQRDRAEATQITAWGTTTNKNENTETNKSAMANLDFPEYKNT